MNSIQKRAGNQAPTGSPILPGRFLLSLLLALAVFLSGAAIAPPAAAQADEDTIYIVQAGDNLSTIAFRHETTVAALLEANPQIEDANRIFPGQRLTIPDGALLPDTGVRGVPTIQVVRVVAGQSVSISTRNFPPNVRFDVLMNESGTQGIGGIRVDSMTTGSRGDFTASFRIPESLRTEDRIVIRLDSPTTNFFSFNTFTNRTSGPRDTAVREVTAAAQRTRDIHFGQQVDFFQGEAGINMPSSSYTGTLELARLSPREAESVKDLRFTQRLLQVNLTDPESRTFPAIFGINYVYFNLDSATRRAYDQGNADIYYFNSNLEQWERCQVPVLITTTNEPNGRLACVMTFEQGFGLYGLAIRR
jgi:LysM repeat protein